jgi:hypothetical protein
MARANQFSLPDFFGLVAYLFVMDRASLNVETLRRASRSSQGQSAAPPPPELRAPALIVEELTCRDYAPLIFSSLPNGIPEAVEEAVAAT